MVRNGRLFQSLHMSETVASTQYFNETGGNPEAFKAGWRDQVRGLIPHSQRHSRDPAFEFPYMDGFNAAYRNGGSKK